MKTFYKHFLYVILFCSLLSLFGCDSGEPNEVDGIVFSEEENYSDTVRSRAETVFYDLMEHYLTLSEPITPPKATLDKLRLVSADLVGLVAELPLGEERFTEILDALELYGKDAVKEFLNGDRNGGKLRELYMEVCSVAGHDYLCKVLYCVLTYSSDYEYKKRMNEYEKYGFPYLLEEANKAAEEKRVLTNDIGEEKFVTFVRGAAAISGLWLGDGFDPEKSTAFTDEEILVFVSKIDFSLELSDDGWRVLLSRIAPLISDSDGFISAAIKNGDVSKLAATMNSFTGLISSIQASLTVETVKMLRNSEREDFIEKVFLTFGESEWALFSDLTAIQLCVEDYEHLYTEKYGDDFARYSETLLPLSIEELKNSVGKGNFYEALERYVGGISPAFSYGMKK